MGFEKKIFSAGMDKDSEARFLKPESYRDALNVQAINTNTGSDGAVESMWGNFQIYNSSIIPNDKCVGTYDDKENSFIYFFIYNPNGTSNKIIRTSYQNNIANLNAETLASGSGLGFRGDPITSIVLVDGLYLYWTDNYNEPGKLVLTSEIIGSNIYIAQDDFRLFTAIPIPYWYPPDVRYLPNSDDPDFNNLNNKLYQFKVRIVYKDGTKSAFSPISKVALPTEVENGTELNNRIRITGNLAAFDVIPSDLRVLVDRIEVAARANNLSDFEIIKEHTQDWTASSYWSIYWENREPSKSLDVTDSNLLYSFVPIKAQALDLIDSNRLVYANFVEGYDNLTDLDASLSAEYTTEPTGWFSFTGSASVAQYKAFFVESLSAPGGPYDVIEFFDDTRPEKDENISITVRKTTNTGVVEDKTFTIDSGALPYSASQCVATFADLFFDYFSEQGDNLINGTTFIPLGTRFLVNNNTLVGVGTGSANYTITELRVTHDNAPEDIKQTVKTWKRATTHKFGLVYYDFAGRPGTVQEFDGNEIYIPRATGREPDLSLLYPTGQVEISMTINHTPPIWAYSYQILYGGQNTYASDPAEGNSFMYFFCHESGIRYLENNRWEISLKELSNFLDIHPDSPLNYSFVTGDKLRYISRLKKEFIPGQNIAQFAFTIDDLEVDDEDLFFDIVEYKSSSNSIVIEVDADGSGTQNFTDSWGEWGGLFEIFHPVNTSNSDTINVASDSFWYELGETYPINVPGTSSRTHGANIQQQTISQPAIVLIESGDTYQKSRVFENYSTLTDRYKTNDSFYRNLGMFLQSVEDQHYSDYYRSNSYDFGRVNVVSKESNQIRRKASMRWSDVYIPDTNINGLGTFFDTAFIDYDKDYGSIQKIYSEDKSLIVFQELKVGKVFTNESILQDSVGQTLVQKSESVMSDIQYYAGEFGIGTHPESFAVYGFAKYFVDPNRCTVMRLSNDGLTKISDYGMRTFFADWLSKAERDTKSATSLWATYNARNDEYVLVMKDLYLTNYTIFFSEKGNRWTSFASFSPDSMGTCGNEFVTYNNGYAWRHNNYSSSSGEFDNYNTFYGTNYDSSITQISNENPSNTKFYKVLEVESNVAPTVDSITNSLGQSSSIADTLFKNKEGVFWAYFLRDINTPNTVLPLYNGNVIRSAEIICKFVYNGDTYFKLFSVGFKYESSELTNR